MWTIRHSESISFLDRCVSESESAHFSESWSPVLCELIADHSLSGGVSWHGWHPHQAQCKPTQSPRVFAQLTLHQVTTPLMSSNLILIPTQGQHCDVTTWGSTSPAGSRTVRRHYSKLIIHLYPVSYWLWAGAQWRARGGTDFQRPDCWW